MILVLPSVVAAPMAQQGLFGGLIEKLTVSLQKFLTYDIRIPHPYPTGSYDEVVPLWSIFAVFTLLFSIIFAASAKIKIFDEEHKGARKAFSVSLALIVMFGAPITELLVITFASYVRDLGLILLIIGLIIGIYLLVLLFSKGLAHGARRLDENVVIRGEKKLEAAEGKKMSQEAGLIKKDLKRERKGFKKLWGLLDKERKAIGDLKEHLIKIREEINLIERLRDAPSKAADAKNRILKELSDLIPIIDKERKIDERTKRITERIQRLEYRDFKLTKKEGRDLKTEAQLVAEVKRKWPQHKDKLNIETLRKYFMRVVQDERFIFQATNRIRQIEIEFNNLNNQIKGVIEKSSIEIRSNNFPQAIHSINEAIELLEKQDGLVVEIERIEQRIMQVARQEFMIENFIQKEEKEEVSAAQKEAAQLRKDEAISSKVKF